MFVRMGECSGKKKNFIDCNIGKERVGTPFPDKLPDLDIFRWRPAIQFFWFICIRSVR